MKQIHMVEHRWKIVTRGHNNNSIIDPLTTIFRVRKGKHKLSLEYARHTKYRSAMKEGKGS